MKLRFVFAVGLGVVSIGSPALAQSKYDVFVGQYMAAAHVVTNCDEFTVSSAQEAGTIAKTQEGLRRQKVLKSLFYGKTAWLNAQGDSTLSERGVDPKNTKKICRFGRAVVGTDDAIGRFLGKK
ncbi:hypothetical protein J7413_03575 [Shimia sp. R10_1]|uniref:DUF5333 family protein n=1 Tax=Shimia sp. R10_1 TaxID=2821095 RepID=UPI001ADCC204|nr:DUF5333 family protein [Shimia sp. R10_1]MBO9472608.1 hypothetical protein [Shimia sp. R10_1]